MQRWPLTILMSAALALGAGHVQARQVTASPDAAFLQNAGQAAEAEIALAALARKQAADARIKALADVLERDHEAARTELQKLAKLKKAELTAMTVA